jgi:hypothetical protein
VAGVGDTATLSGNSSPGSFARDNSSVSSKDREAQFGNTFSGPTDNWSVRLAEAALRVIELPRTNVSEAGQEHEISSNSAGESSSYKERDRSRGDRADDRVQIPDGEGHVCTTLARTRQPHRKCPRDEVVASPGKE